MPKMESKLTFLNVRRKRSFDLQNKTVTATVDSMAVQKLIEILNEGKTDFLKLSNLKLNFVQKKKLLCCRRKSVFKFHSSNHRFRKSHTRKTRMGKYELNFKKQ